MKKINGIYLEKINDDEFKVREWHEEKGCYYVASYTSDEIYLYFNIKKEDIE